MRKKYSEDQVRDLLRKIAAERTQYKIAAEMGVTAAYLSDVCHGRRTPGPSILEWLKLRKRVVYETIDNA